MKLLITFCSLIFSVLAFSQANWSDTTFVHRDGQAIVDGNGDTIQLNGVNLGGWLMWEGWIWGGNFTQEKTIYNDIESVIGTTAADAFREDVYDQFITREDIKEISEQCHNVVRIPFNHFILEDDATPYSYKQSGWNRLDSVLSWCEDYNVYAVLDLHSAPGGQSNLFTADPDFLINLWNENINQERTYRLWKAIADRYKDRGIIAGYDLLNEPDAPEDTTLVNIYENIIDSIRSVDNNHMLFIEGNDFAKNFSMFTSPLDNNITYEFHFYSWFFNSTKADTLAKYANLSNTTGFPIWCGEWGEDSEAELSSTKALFEDPQYKLSGSAMWTWKKVSKSTSQGDYYAVDTTDDWYKTIQWIGNHSNPLPTPNEMNSGINDFLSNAELSNCHLNENIAEIMSSCLYAHNKEIIIDYLNAYPNPTDGLIHFSAENPLEIKQIDIYNQAGKLVKTVNDQSTLNISELESGFYLLEIRTENYQFRSKVVLE